MKAEFKAFLTGYSGYIGGDIGSKEKPAIWCCGIEAGGYDMTAEKVKGYLDDKEWWQTISGLDEGENIISRFDQVVCKLLCVINGGDINDYKTFASENKIWIKDAKTGYLKMNLYPLWFKDTKHHRWDHSLVELLGFADKAEYIEWCRLHRFPKIRARVQQYQPKLILCFGISYAEDFNLAFSDVSQPFNQEIIDNLGVKWKYQDDSDTLFVVLPFPNAPRGLKSYQAIQLIGEFIRNKLAK